MKRRHFVFSTLGLGAVPPTLFAAPTPAAGPTGDAPRLDPEMKNPAEKPDPELVWHDPREWGLEGRVLPDQERLRFYDRLPASAADRVRKPVWDLSRHSTGMAIRFKSNASQLVVRYAVSSEKLAMPHMPATGASGVDLYARNAQGKWQWVNVSKPTSKETSAILGNRMPAAEREWMLYLPLYNGVESLEIGVNAGASFEGLAPRQEGLIAFYGTSITHGACASRPGMCHVAQLGRRLDRPVLNWGFSGNGTMDAEVGEYLCRISPALFVIDCVPNMNAAEVARKCPLLVKQIRAARPETPILLVEDRRNTNSWLNPARAAHHDANHAALRQAFESLKKEGVKKLFYLPGDHLMGDDGDGSTDGSHPSDLGYFRQADAFEPAIRQALQA